MKNKLKTIILAFSGVIVYSALLTVTPMFIDSYIYSKLVAGIALAVLGGVYTTTVLKNFGPKININRKFLIMALIVTIVYCFTSLFTSNLILRSINDTAFAQQATNTANREAESLLLSMAMSVILAPIVEELIFRGFMYRFLSDFNKLAAMAISSVMFALWHGTIVHLYAAFFGGLIFCIIYDRTCKLRYSIFAHMLFNGMTIVISYIPYPSFMLTPWCAIVLNILFFAFLIILLKTQGSKITETPALTKKQKQDKKQTEKIVEDVLSEHKSRH